jgi:Tfp pilus assembly protein PilO
MKIDNRQQILIVATIAIAALFISDKVIVTPLSGLWGERAKEIKTLRAKIAEGKSYRNREQSLRNHWDDFRKNTLPNNNSLAPEQVLKALQEWAQESAASLNATTPQWKNDSDDYKTLVCRVDASGSLWELSRFLYDVENSPMALKIESLDLNSKDTTGQQLTLGMQISGLVLTPHTK